MADHQKKSLDHTIIVNYFCICFEAESDNYFKTNKSNVNSRNTYWSIFNRNGVFMFLDRNIDWLRGNKISRKKRWPKRNKARTVFFLLLMSPFLLFYYKLCFFLFLITCVATICKTTKRKPMNCIEFTITKTPKQLSVVVSQRQNRYFSPLHIYETIFSINFD